MASNTTRIAKNTLMLYFRQILIMLVSLYTVRVVLNTLGAEDYGIYNVVAGVVAMFGFLSNSMATSSQRYFSFEIGRRDFEQLKKVFSLSLTIYVLIGVLVLVLGETIGLWLVNNKLVIPVERKEAAFWIYQFAILSFLFTMITTPYMASVIAHENMNVYAYVSIVEVALKLFIVFVLRWIAFDKLVLYGILMFLITFINTGIYRIICTKKYNECKFRFFWDYALFKEMTSYVGWNLIGSVSGIIRNQGINILLNIFFGPVVNAARAIAVQVNAAVNSFAQNFTTAVRPQIVKSYAAEEKSQMILLIFRSTKFTFFLLLFFVIPLQIELVSVLKLWLRQVPEKVVVFTRIMLIDSMINSIGLPFAAALQATGKIKTYQIMFGTIYVFNLPLSLLLLVLGFSAETVQVVGVVSASFLFMARIFMSSRQIQFSIRQCIKEVLLPSIIVVLIGSIVPVCFVNIYPEGNIRLLLTIILSTVSLVITVFVLGIQPSERILVFNKIKEMRLFFKKDNHK
jgi:O-antigen/teichoic acid export membrane protein